MDEKKTQIPWWEPAVKVFGQVTGLIAAPIIIALFAGQALDNAFGSEPLFFIGLTALAIILSTVSIVRIASRYIKEIEKESKDKIHGDRTDNK